MGTATFPRVASSQEQALPKPSRVTRSLSAESQSQRRCDTQVSVRRPPAIQISRPKMSRTAQWTKGCPPPRMDGAEPQKTERSFLLAARRWTCWAVFACEHTFRKNCIQSAGRKNCIQFPELYTIQKSNICLLKVCQSLLIISQQTLTNF